jgi:rhodanese-related sulfurtransferase
MNIVSFQTWTWKSFKDHIKKDPGIYIDVRTREEWDLKSYKSFLWVPFGPFLESYLKGLSQKYAYDQLLVFLCARGRRSERAAQYACTQGWTQVAHIGEGLEGNLDLSF